MPWFTFTDASREVFVVRLDDPDLVAHARALLAGEDTDPRIGGTVVKTDVAWNVGWSYHLDPDSVFFFEMSTEVGDSTMRYIENHLEDVGGHLLPGRVWTGWTSTLTGELGVLGGGAGADLLRGTAAADLVFGRRGDDALHGGWGDDHLAAGAGDDLARGGWGRDRLGGEGGADVLKGGRGRDVLDGGAGRDSLDGGVGNDRLMGGAGADRFVLRPGSGADRVDDFQDGGAAEDRIDLRAFRGEAFDEVGIEAQGLDLVLRMGDESLRLAGYLRDHALSEFGVDDLIL